MSLEVKIRKVTRLLGKADRFCTVTFRGIPSTSVVLTGVTKEAVFDEEFYWPLETNLDKDEWVEVRLFNRNKIFQDRLVGVHRFSLFSICHGGHAEVKEHLIDAKHNILQSEIFMEVIYTRPSATRYDMDTRSERSISIQPLIEKEVVKDDAIDLMANMEDIVHPRIKHPKIVNVETQEWVIQMRIIEGRDLAGVSLSPYVTVTLGGDLENQKVTKTVKHNCNPEWDELLIYDLMCPKEILMDKILKFEVFTKRGLISDDEFIGSFKCDIWYIYDQPFGSIFSKFAPLLDSSTFEMKGFLRMDLQVFCRGDVVKDPPPRPEEIEIEQNLILPPKTNPYRPVYQYQVKVLKAEGIPQMNTGFAIMANMRKAFTNSEKDLADPFVQITFGEYTQRTKEKKSTYTPEFNEVITFTDFFPPLCKRMKIQLKDKDLTGEEIIGTHFLDLSQISHPGDKVDGFMPLFGPAWVNLYGALRDYSTSEEHQELSCGLGEGIAYRGRVLIWVECIESEPMSIGVERPEAEPIRERMPDDMLRREEDFQLLATFYEATMIPKLTGALGDKTIKFEVAIGEYNCWSQDGVSHQWKRGSIEDGLHHDDEKIYTKEKVYVSSLTRPYPAVSTSDRKYVHIPFGREKPCAHIKFPFQAELRRHFNTIILEKIKRILEESLVEMEDRVKLNSPTVDKLLRKIMGEVIYMCTMFLELVDGKKTNSHLGKSALDLERDKLLSYEIKQVSMSAAKLVATCDEDEDFTKISVNEKLEKVSSLLSRVKRNINEPQQGLPDVFIWLISGNKRIAYARIPAEDILYSERPDERGMNAGCLQTIYLRLPGMYGHGKGGWAIQGKLEVRLWLGLFRHKTQYIKNYMESLEDPDARHQIDKQDIVRKAQSIPPSYFEYKEIHKYVVRCHIYQARGLIGSDDTGLSDALLRCVVSNQSQDTFTVYSTRSPTWDTMLKFEIEMWGDVAELAVNPPPIVCEIFDQDPGGEEEFIGRMLAKPVVKLATEKYARPFFPPALQWFPIYRGESRAGDVLAAFEMLQMGFNTELPPDPLVDSEQGNRMKVPDNVRPAMQDHRVEVLFWGVRDIKRVQYLSVNKPFVKLDCCYEVQEQKEDGSVADRTPTIKSVTIQSARVNPNFHDNVAIFDVSLPEKEKYLPPMTIQVYDQRAFNRVKLCGSFVIESLFSHFMNKEDFQSRKNVEEDKGKRADMEEPSFESAEVEEKGDEQTEDVEDNKDDNEEEEEEELLDWWTRFYATIRDIEEEEENKRLKELADQGVVVKKRRLKLPTSILKVNIGQVQSNGDQIHVPGADIPRLTIYDQELEKVPQFGKFNDFLISFDLLRGKKIDDDEYEDQKRRYSGRFKGNIRVWEHSSLPDGFDMKDPMGSFYKLPSSEPLKVMVRVYVIRCMGLYPMDHNGKSDPYLFCELGNKSFNLKKEYCSKTLDPYFGKYFEFEARIPFDYMVRVAIYDWDAWTGDDLIGETWIDIENLFYSKHRPKCGLQKDYITHGYAKWRDPEKPSAILIKLCKEYYIEGPEFYDYAHTGDEDADEKDDNEKYNDVDWSDSAKLIDGPRTICKIDNEKFGAESFIMDERGKRISSNEPAALHALHNFQKLKRGFHIVPEHVETRTLYNPEKPQMKMGKVQMWIDMFSMDLSMPGDPVNIEVRKPIDYELRVIIWNTEDVLADEMSLSGEMSSDIFIKGWLEGMREDLQSTDVHYTARDGCGMFNWRFVFPFQFHKAEEKFVTYKKASLFAVDLTEEKLKPLINIQCWDADLFSADDFLGDLTMRLTRLPFGAKSAKQCSLKLLEAEAPTANLFKIKQCRGWWPVQDYDHETGDRTPILTGKIEMEFDLLLKEDAEVDPAGKGRDEPHALDKPNRPDRFKLLGPLTMLRYMIWEPCKWNLLKLLICLLVILLVALFLYSMPGYTIKKLFGA